MTLDHSRQSAAVEVLELIEIFWDDFPALSLPRPSLYVGGVSSSTLSRSDGGGLLKLTGRSNRYDRLHASQHIQSGFEYKSGDGCTFFAGSR